MNIEFKDCGEPKSRTTIDQLRSIILDFLSVNTGYKRSTVADSVEIKSSSQIVLTFPTANSDWSAGVALLILLINLSGVAYTFRTNRGLVIKPTDGHLLDHVEDIIKKNMNAKVSICK